MENLTDRPYDRVSGGEIIPIKSINYVDRTKVDGDLTLEIEYDRSQVLNREIPHDIDDPSLYSPPDSEVGILNVSGEEALTLSYLFVILAGDRLTNLNNPDTPQSYRVQYN